MDDIFREVLDLQKQWTHENSDAMKRRGVLVRKKLPELLREHVGALGKVMGVPGPWVSVEGRDGTGRKTQVPWTRVFDPQRSSSATTGWYLVYLFGGTGDRVYLSLNQGTTRWTGTVFAPRSRSELRARVAWARPLLEAEAADRDDLIEAIDLKATKSKLDGGYEAGNVLAIAYDRNALPSAATFVEDLQFMARLLAILYREEDAAPHVPGDEAPEVLDATDAATQTAGRRSGARTGQGFRLTAPERRALEQHSVQMAIEHFEAQGWTVSDVGDKESYDLFMKRGKERLFAEVKGTTSEGAQVVLTRSEVEHQRRLAPHNALVVVQSIRLDRTVSPPVASGGILHCTSPWTIEEDDLTVVSYLYRTGL